MPTGGSASQTRTVLSRAVERINEVHRTRLSLEKLNDLESGIRSTLQTALSEGTWKKDFRGRVILKELLQELKLGLKYELFRNLLVSKMRDKGIQPEGMKKVINDILAA